MSGYTILTYLTQNIIKKAVMNYMEYLVTCQLDEQQMSSLLYERDDLSAIDFFIAHENDKSLFIWWRSSNPCIKTGFHNLKYPIRKTDID